MVIGLWMCSTQLIDKQYAKYGNILHHVAGAAHGYASHGLSPRLTRLFIMLNLFSVSDNALDTMHNKTIFKWLEQFPSTMIEHPPELATVSHFVTGRFGS